MRLWSLHPSYLDQKALVAVWREGLLARAVLRGATRGYRSHPQLARFREHRRPVSAINHYLQYIAEAADVRGYDFDRSRIGPVRDRSTLTVTSDQLAFEMAHLRKKVYKRTRSEYWKLKVKGPIITHPLFNRKKGAKEHWEKGAA